MAQRQQVIEILAPTSGRKHDAPSTMIDYRAQSTGAGAKMYFGVNQKEYGTTLYATGSNSVITGGVAAIFEANFANGRVLEVLSPTAVYKYTSSGDTYVSDGQMFTGTYTDFWSGVVYNDVFVYSNGVDPIQVKSSVSATGTNLASAMATNTYKAWCLAAYHDHLNLYHTIENGTECSKRIRWSANGPLTLSASTADFGAGTAGAIDLPDMEGSLQVAVPLGITIAVYAERSVHIQTWIGGQEVYQFTKTLSNLGTPSRRGALSRGDVNFFIGAHNFYEYHGGDDYREIGDAICDFAFGEINNAALNTSFVEFDEQFQEVLFHVPTGTSTSPNVVWSYRMENGSWSRLERSFSATGRSTRRTGLTIGELQGTIGDQQFRYGDYSAKAGSEVALYGDLSGYVTKKDPTVYSLCQSGTQAAQTFIYATPDIVGFKSQDPYDKDNVTYNTTDKRYLKFSFEAVGNGQASVFYSTDMGRSLVQFPESPVSINSTSVSQELDLDIAAPQARFVIVNSATNEFIGIRYAKVGLIPESTQ